MGHSIYSHDHKVISVHFDSVQFNCTIVSICTPMDCRTLGLPVHHQLLSLLKLMSIESVMPSNHLILCHPLFLSPSIFPSIRVFSNESVLCIRWPKNLSFNFSISPFNEYSGLSFFRMDWLDLLVVQGTLKSLLQHHSSKASILWHSAFFTIQLSHPYMTTGKTIALTRWTFVGKVMSLLFNKPSRSVIAFLPRSKSLLVPWLQSPSAVILEHLPPNKVCHCFHCFPVYLPWSDGPDAMILVFWMLSFKPTFSLSSFTFKRHFSSSLSAIRWCHLRIWGYWYFSWHSWFQLVLHPGQHFSWCTLHIR